ncbi:MAG TPA: pilus assembly protein N-terminal domain-containing protein [Polyangiaceae bacterium]|nr:pilus assembly protein N-terminal domain-containing protein [Polyangiaceae bacterium]
MNRRAAQVSSALLGLLLYTGPSGAQPPDKASHPEVPDATAVVRQQQDEVNLSVGENRTLSAVGVRSYSVGAPGIVDVRLTPDNSQFVLTGQQPGSTTLLLLKKDNSQVSYALNVYPRPVERVESELLQLLDGTPGMRVRKVGPRFFIEGGVSTEPELKRIDRIAAQFPGQVESLVVLGGAAAERRINVRIDFFFIEFDRTKSYQIGIGYPGKVGPGAFEASYSFLGGGFTSATASVVNQPLPGLDLAATRGWAKVLKHSTILTANGAEAKFSSGGEQNYVITSGLSASLSQINFGTDVTVLPRFDPVARELEVRIDAQVSDLTPSVAAGTNLPGRAVSKLQTLVSVKLGQSIVLSGIRTRSQRHGVSGLPLLSQIPLLGVLFGSHSDDQQDVEGAVLLVPSVVESVPRSAHEVLDDALAKFEKYSGDLDDAHAWDENSETPAPARSSGH